MTDTPRPDEAGGMGVMARHDAAGQVTFEGPPFAALPPDAQARLAAAYAHRPPPMAEVQVRVFSLDPGRVEVSVGVSPAGALAAAQGHDPAAKALAYAHLRACLERELRDALTLLGGMPPPPERRGTRAPLSATPALTRKRRPPQRAGQLPRPDALALPDRRRRGRPTRRQPRNRQQACRRPARIAWPRRDTARARAAPSVAR